MQAVSYTTEFKSLLKLLALTAFLFFGSTTFAQQITTYDEAIKYGDKLYNNSELIDAKAYYQQALKIKPNDEYAKQRITLIVDKMKSSLSAEDEFYDIIDFADELYDDDKLDEATNQYKKALKIVPDDEYALSKIREITTFQTNEQDKIDSFNKAMEAGKVYATEKEYDNALASFKEALSIFPDKNAPINEINNVNNLKSEYEQRENLYLEKLDEADKLLLIKNYSEALNIYIEADNILPEKEDAKIKISEIKPLADKQRKYNKQIEEADELYISKDFISARRSYSLASNIWSEKNYPNDMISKIDEKLEDEKKDLENNYSRYIFGGDSLFDKKEYSQAIGQYNLALNLKPNEAYPKSKVTEIESYFENQRQEFEANYDIMISSADSAFESGSYYLAREKYETALTVKPDNQYPQNQLDLIENKLIEIAALDKINSTYNDLINQADILYSSGNYDLAINKYKEAKALKSVETYPQEKINAILQLMADAAKQKQINEKYNELIIVAVQQFNQDKLNDARLSFVNATELKPNELMPKKQISKIDSLLVIKAELAEIKDKYDNYIKDGDSLYQQKEYSKAIISYDLAIALIPENDVARKKKLTVETTQINIRKAAERKKAYDDAIAKGDKLFDDGSFELARVEFEKARSLRNDQEYPGQRLLDISNELKRLEAEKEERYDESISTADNYFEQANYEDAVIKYQLANSIKPEERYPQQKIAECNGFIAEKLKQLAAEYSVYIADADKLYASKIYDKAIISYRKAGNIKPDETYPNEMIDKISKYIEENSIVDVINQSDTITASISKRFDFNPVKINVRKSNYIFIKAKNLSGNPFKIIFSYGSNNGKQGGFVVQVVEGEEFNDYIVRVGNQYKWFSEDNNWFTIVPENGDVEITMLRISKGY